MFDLFLLPNALPFSIALAVTAGLFVIEIVSLMLGATVLGLGGEAPDIDIDTDFDLSADIDLDGLDADVVGELSPAPSGILTWIGARDVPFLIWLVSFLTMFGLFGLIVQSVAISALGTPLFTLLAVAIAVFPALAVTRIIANWVALIMPKTETSALRMRFLGGSRGTITQGTARRGAPAEVKIKDRHGNIHYLRVEPLDDDGVFPQGSDVTLIRKRGDKFFVI
ncbi:YqiJ family protein [Octadecabacter sp. G9-8]|uniref:YqiJ family protein n=1 Tax=Octadecabacter dasysiphoniae TaxID=2909341 RepID=A0ABS9CVV5_9RHOB|nr:YqiJ family protein [Octadecabacter dasysiphoniae]MCF2870509.1 YqiJ family protein [Octadecabacter dasysiphoniae]